MKTPITEISTCPYGKHCATCCNAKHITTKDGSGFDTFCTIYTGKEDETQEDMFETLSEYKSGKDYYSIAMEICYKGRMYSVYDYSNDSCVEYPYSNDTDRDKAYGKAVRLYNSLVPAENAIR